MNFSRITPEQIADKGVAAAPDVLTGTASENKGIFDRLVREVVTAAYNGLLDALEAATGAGGLGAEAFPNVEGTTVQAQLKGIQGNVEGNHAFLGTQAGAAYVGAAPVGILKGNTVQGQILGLLAAHEGLKNADGAAYVGAAPFNGAPSGTVQGQLRDVMKAVEDINAGIIPVQSVTMEKLGLDVVEKIEAPVVTHTSTELDDYAAEVGAFPNAGAGWNTYRFRESFEAPPVVVACPQAFSGWVEVKDITAVGFLYCLRRPKLNAGTVDTDSFFVGNGAGTNPNHSAETIVTGVTLPTLTTETVADGVNISYIAIENGGER